MAEYIVKWDDDMRHPEWKEQIVRCKDCRYFDDHVIVPGCTIHDFAERNMEDGFCSWGERKGES